MKIQIVICILTIFASSVTAQTSFDDLDDAQIQVEVEKLTAECAALSDGQIINEVFGITFRRLGEICILGEGEVSPRWSEFLDETGYGDAGMQGDNSIWIMAKPPG